MRVVCIRKACMNDHHEHMHTYSGGARTPLCDAVSETWLMAVRRERMLYLRTHLVCRWVLAKTRLSSTVMPLCHGITAAGVCSSVFFCFAPDSEG